MSYYGWGGFFRTDASVTEVLDKIHAAGWNLVRYYSMPRWYATRFYPNGFPINHARLERLIQEADKRNMTVCLDIAHNYPHTASYHLDEPGMRGLWIDEYIADLAAIHAYSYDNIIFDLWNEYDGTSERIVAHYNAMLAALRGHGYEQPAYLNVWWNQFIEGICHNIDDDNFMLGMHIYAQSRNFHTCNPAGADYNQTLDGCGIRQYFDEWFIPEWVNPVRDRDIDFFIGEIGTGWAYNYLRGGIAYVMYMLRHSLTDEGIHVCLHSVPCAADYHEYYNAAQNFFDMSFFGPPPEPQPPEPEPEPPEETVIARLISNPAVINTLRIMRNFAFTKEQHKKLHPLI